jgi:7 transmembrane receptor (rhodopsin family)
MTLFVASERLPNFTDSVRINCDRHGALFSSLYTGNYQTLLLMLQAMNLLIVNQSCIDLLASIILLLWSTVPVTVFPMSNSSLRDQFVCHVWLSRFLPWSLLFASTYSVLAITIERFLAIVHPVVHKVHVRTSLVYRSSFITSSKRPINCMITLGVSLTSLNVGLRQVVLV